MVNWTADKDQTLLKGIFVFHDIKNSAPLLKYLAEQIGEGCTPKAVGHRLSNLRNSGKMVNSGGSSSTPKKAVAAPRTPRTLASGCGGVAKASSNKNIDNDTTSEDAMDEELPSPSVGRKRSRTSKTPKSYAESDATTGVDEEEFTPVTKRVKAKPVEDEGVVGFTTSDGHFEEEDEAVAFV